MIAPRTLRTCLRRLNVLLLAAVVCLAVQAATWIPAPREPLPEQPRFDGAQPWRPAADAQAEFDQLLTYLRTFHPAAPVGPFPDLTPSEPSRLPLRAYRVAMVIEQPGTAPLVLLKPKDPSLGRDYYLTQSKPHRDARLVWLRHEGEVGKVRIERGEEAFTFEFRSDRPMRRGGLTLAERRPLPAPGDSSPQSPQSRSRRVPLSRDLKGLPFYGTDGAVVGMRVSGVRPGSYFARVGLKSGDVITGAEDGSTANIEAFRERLGDGWHPRSLTVLRNAAKSRTTLTLRGS